ncbi:MAG: phosphoenolpyruvate synthase [Herpetosiphonaceae bacterium]|nr:MAG: phosphoenolpyruvate synthase [Herpetosiphonaceae bacterium]
MKTKPYLLSLDEITAEDGDLVGSKALRLAELRQVGVAVPPGFVITNAAYALVRETPGGMPIELQQAIADAYAALGDHVAVAVRSSASAEDSHGASFAGQYSSFLNIIGIKALLEHIAACWASLYEEHAVHYRSSKGIDEQVAMAVLVQQLVPAEAAGVMFTLNPLSGLEEELVIEASWGLGEALVSGLVTPDRYLVDRDQGVVRERTIAEKRLQIAAGAQGTVKHEVTPERRTIAVLDDQQILSLAALGEQIQAHYGAPLDIEWALSGGRFFILQARPLTSYQFGEEIGQWTSANFREVLPGIVTPLIFSMDLDHGFVGTFSSFARSVRLTDQPEDVVQSRLFFGRPYWRTDRIKAILKDLPGFKERNFDISIGLTPTYEGNGYQAPINVRTLWRGLRILPRLWKLYATYATEAAAFQRRFLTTMPRLRAANIKAFSHQELSNWLKDVIQLYDQTFTVEMTCSILADKAQQDLLSLLEMLNKKLPAHRQVSAGRLLAGLSGIGTAKPLRALCQVARAAARFPEIREIIQSTPPEQLEEALRSFAGGQFWRAYLEGYRERFGYMSSYGEDFCYPRWDEDFSLPLMILRALVGGEDADPGDRTSEQRLIREREEGALRGIAQTHPVLAGLIGAIALHLRIVRRYIWWRETTRDLLSQMIAYTRKLLLEQGQRWVGPLLDQADDIFWLYRDELLHALEGSLSSDQARALVARRRQTARNYRNFNPPQIIGAGSRPAQREQLDGQLLTGVPCSPGIVEGRARVLTRLDDAGRLQPGEILIAPYINPSWTPLFAIAGGVVTEEGGLLSHGAVVAREWGLPTVLQVKDATRRIRDGQHLWVDGTRGVVTIKGMSAIGPFSQERSLMTAAVPLPMATPTAEMVIERLVHSPQEARRSCAPVLANAFYTDVFYKHLMPWDEKRHKQLLWWMGVMTDYASRYGHVYVARDQGRIIGATLWLGPGEPVVKSFPMAFKSGLIYAFFKLGVRGTLRMLDLTFMWQYWHEQEPKHHWYLLIAGVEPQYQNKGIGSQMMMPVLKQADATGMPCYLEATCEANVRFYRRHGFEVVRDGAPYWTMRRPARGER